MARIFSKRTFSATSRYKVKEEVLRATESDPNLRAEMRKVFRAANKRIYALENSGELSPALQSLGTLEPGFTKFGFEGNDWQQLKINYARAVSFLRQPTSTLGGVHEYGKHIQQAYNLTEDEYKMMSFSLLGRLNSLSDTAFVERYLMRYKDFTGELERSAKDVGQQIESEAQRLSDAIQEEIERQAEEAAQQYEATNQAIINVLRGLKKFGV